MFTFKQVLLDFIFQARIILGYLTEKIKAQQSNTKDNEHSVFPQGNHKWKKPRNFLRDRINTKSKTQNNKKTHVV